MCDVILAATGADLVILNSGTFRSDQVHPAGDFTMRDLTNIIPMRDPLVVLKVTGKTFYMFRKFYVLSKHFFNLAFRSDHCRGIREFCIDVP